MRHFQGVQMKLEFEKTDLQLQKIEVLDSRNIHIYFDVELMRDNISTLIVLFRIRI